MSLSAFVDAMTGSAPAETLELTDQERSLLTAMKNEDSRNPNFNFAQSASMRAVKHVRENASSLSGAQKQKFVKYVSDTFASSYRGAAVQSGCVVPCKAF